MTNANQIVWVHRQIFNRLNFINRIASSLFKVVETRGVSITISPKFLAVAVYESPINSPRCLILPYSTQCGNSNANPPVGGTACTNVNSTTWTCPTPSTLYSGDNVTFILAFQNFKTGNTISSTPTPFTGTTTSVVEAQVNSQIQRQVATFTALPTSLAVNYYAVLATYTANMGITSVATQSVNVQVDST